MRFHVIIAMTHRWRSFQESVAKKTNDLDILVNNAWGGYEQMEHEGRVYLVQAFWEQPFWRWDAMFDGGVRAAFVASAFAAG